MAPKTVAGLVERMNRLYERGADSLRIGQYVRRWMRWVRSGLAGESDWPRRARTVPAALQRQRGR